MNAVVLYYMPSDASVCGDCEVDFLRYRRCSRALFQYRFVCLNQVLMFIISFTQTIQNVPLQNTVKHTTKSTPTKVK